MRATIFFLAFFLLPYTVFAAEKIVNVYAWTGEIPEGIVRQFEHETGIKVNFSSYENNEIMYAKLRASKDAGYDVIMPSSYFADRMRKQHMLLKLDHEKLSHWKNINPVFLNPIYDPDSKYTTPYIVSITGMFVNKQFYSPKLITKWSDLWDKRFLNKIMLLDDTREVFSMALISLGYSANDSDPAHIYAAYLHLKALMKNVKVFSTETVVSIIIDEDVNVGMAWNGDMLKAMQENKDVAFIFPKDGYVITIDTFAIPVNAPHKEEAYAFINYMLRADVARDSALATGFPTTNLAGQRLLPAEIQHNPAAYPSKEVLKRGQYQTDLSDEALALYEKYWEELKMSG